MSTINGRACVANGKNLFKDTRNLSATSTTATWGVLFDSSQIFDSLIKHPSEISAITFSFNVYIPSNATVGSNIPIQLKGQNPQATDVGTDDFNTLLGVSNYVIKQSDLGTTIRASYPIGKDGKYQSFDNALADTASIIIRQSSDTSGFVYSKIKLEIGSVATPWSPAPEDVM